MGPQRAQLSPAKEPLGPIRSTETFASPLHSAQGCGGRLVIKQKLENLFESRYTVSMQLNKASKKTVKNADKAVAAAPESTVVAEVAAKPRVSRSSKTKKSEGQEMTSGKHLHKSASPVLAEPVVSQEAVPPTSKLEVKHVANPAKTDPQAIARLAYSYWVERGHAHGFAEQDWLRAEKELTVS